MRTKLVVHHSESPSYTSLMTIESWHRQKNFTRSALTGFHIGYTWCVDNETGKTTQIRGTNEDCCAAASWDEEAEASYNRSANHVCVVGNFEIEYPTKYAVNAIVKILKDNPHLTKLIGHNEIKDVTKSCPGKHLSKELPAIRRRAFKRSWLRHFLKALWNLFFVILKKIGTNPSHKSSQKPPGLNIEKWDD